MLIALVEVVVLGEAVLTPDIKYKLGWIIVPGLGPMPLPNALWTDEYKRFNAPLTFWLNCGLIYSPSAGRQWRLSA